MFNLETLYKKSDVIFGNNCQVSPFCSLENVIIGDNVIIGAGSVVTKDIPDNYLAFGNPCHPIREITELDSKKDLILEADKEHFKYNLK